MLSQSAACMCVEGVCVRACVRGALRATPDSLQARNVIGQPRQLVPAQVADLQVLEPREHASRDVHNVCVRACVCVVCGVGPRSAAMRASMRTCRTPRTIGGQVERAQPRNGKDLVVEGRAGRVCARAWQRAGARRGCSSSGHMHIWHLIWHARQVRLLLGEHLLLLVLHASAAAVCTRGQPTAARGLCGVPATIHRTAAAAAPQGMRDSKHMSTQCRTALSSRPGAQVWPPRAASTGLLFVLQCILLQASSYS